MYKLSPFHQLSDSQYGVKEQIIDYCRRNLKKLKEGEHKVFLVKERLAQERVLYCLYIIIFVIYQVIKMKEIKSQDYIKQLPVYW